ncbi:RagB/SusD family nutrient uptake outer membrane protein [Mucilaginibacter mali]|uniref:RagB/SusD family nutrient uptake outer membrane protein n=1 Tax=Mucilaginibacter mali TaxID=2740462 RepID=A0A7D4Q7K4_9SPHI|nr:RagB/SusD family nutrient uptake outer membrane protein [Mucilaginibacter mali]QKJ29205.1 RagB/SusD family nutrient uptake outer membrane protein [Mucilaginibacter mali]
MKKILFIAFTGIVILSSACKKLLDEDVRTQISNLYLNTPAGIEDGVKGCYATLRMYYGSQSAGWMTVFGTDEYQNGNADATYANYTANLNAANGTTGGIWNALYIGINDCNTMIENIPAVTGMTQTLKNIRMGEVRFLRAHYYFLLVQQFGGLDLRLSSTRSASKVASRAPIADVYKAIIEDLTFAIANLPATTSDYGRVTIAPAKHMLAKVYLTRAGSTAAVATDYDNAAAIAKDVIATGGYKLVSDFSELWAQPSKPNTETMLACQFSNNIVSEPTVAPASGSNISAWNAANFDFCAGYEGKPGITRDLANGRPFGHYRPTAYMVNLYNKTADSRFAKTFKTVWLCNAPNTAATAFTINGNTGIIMARGDTCISILDHDITAAQKAKYKYTVLTPSTYEVGLWPQNKKFEDSLRATVNDSRGIKDFPIYRLGETYLIAAEALTMSGKQAEAATYINALRARSIIQGSTPAITAANTAAMQVTAADMNIDFILDERARELSGEFMRWTDLVRTGKLLERVQKYNPVATLLIKPYHILRPIPQVQIDRTEGTSTSFPQNPGY